MSEWYYQGNASFPIKLHKKEMEIRREKKRIQDEENARKRAEVMDGVLTDSPNLTLLDSWWDGDKHLEYSQNLWTALSEHPCTYLKEIKSGGLRWAKPDDKRLVLDTIAHLIRRNDGHNALESVHVDYNKLRGSHIQSIGHALLQNSTVTRINVGKNDLGPDGAMIIAEVIRHSNTLRIVEIACNSIRDEGFIAIADALAVNTSLHKLDIGSNDTFCASCIAMANAIRQNTTLKTLRIGDIIMEDDGCIAIASALLQNNSLEQINLAYNEIGDKGAAAMAEVVASEHFSMTKFDIGSNAFEHDGSLLMIRALCTNRTIVDLGLSLDDTNEVGEAFVAMLQKNYKLVDVDFFGNLPPVHKEAAKQSLKFNRERPLEAEIQKSGLFPSRLLLKEHEWSPACHAQLIAKVVQCHCLSSVYSLMRERPNLVSL